MASVEENFREMTVEREWGVVPYFKKLKPRTLANKMSRNWGRWKEQQQPFFWRVTFLQPFLNTSNRREIDEWNPNKSRRTTKSKIKKGGNTGKAVAALDLEKSGAHNKQGAIWNGKSQGGEKTMRTETWKNPKGGV